MKVTLLRFELRTEAPLSVGAGRGSRSAGGGGREVDLPISTDGKGRPHVPTSSVAGSLRAHLRANDADEALMGSRRPERRSDESAPSLLRLVGTSLEIDGRPLEATHVEDRQRTAVDPVRGAARTNTLRRSEQLPAGSTILVYARADGEISPEHLSLLAGWTPVLGSGRGIGNGRCKLISLRHGMLDLDDEEHLITWLSHGGPTLHELVTTEEVEKADATTDVLIAQEVRVVDGLAAGSGADHPDLDRPLLRSAAGVPIIDGSSIRGVLRARAGYILRSVGAEACTDLTGCGTCKLCELFGSTRARSLVSIDHATIADAVTAKRMHVGIDRFTGGAADRLLFDDEVVTAGTFTLVVRRSDTRDLPGWAEPLLRWCIRDILDGLVGIGGLTSRGYGTVTAHGEDVIGEPPALSVLLDGSGAPAPAQEVAS